MPTGTYSIQYCTLYACYDGKLYNMPTQRSIKWKTVVFTIHQPFFFRE